jgi:hypothetical protein
MGPRPWTQDHGPKTMGSRNGLGRTGNALVRGPRTDVMGHIQVPRFPSRVLHRISPLSGEDANRMTRGPGGGIGSGRAAMMMQEGVTGGRGKGTGGRLVRRGDAPARDAAVCGSHGSAIRRRRGRAQIFWRAMPVPMPVPVPGRSGDRNGLSVIPVIRHRRH